MRICSGKNLICTLRLLLLVAVAILSPGTNRAQTPVKSQPETDTSVRVKDVASDDDNIIRSNSGSSASKPRLSAIVVGISDYKFDTIYNDLTYARRDAEKFAQLIGCASEIQVDTIIRLFDQDATVANMDEALKYMRSCLDDTRSSRPKPDYIVFFFSGHGQLNSFDEDKEGYYVMYDTDKSSCQDMGYPHRNIIKFIKHRMFRYKFLVVSDACHAGRLLGSSEVFEGSTLPVLSELTQVAVDQTGSVFELLSSQGSEKSYEFKSLKHGVFSYYLIKGALGEADRDRDGVIENIEIGDYVRKKVSRHTPYQNPVFNYNRGIFPLFNPCLEGYSDNDLTETKNDKSVNKEESSPKSPVVLKTRFDSLLYNRQLCGEEDSSAFAYLVSLKSPNIDSEVYEDMRSRYISAVLEEDADIMYRYLNQDLNPWLTKFADIEKEIEMHESLISLLQKEDLSLRRIVSRYYFFQAMAWYEYAKFVPGMERKVRLKKANKLIARSLELKPDSPVACFLQSQIYLGLNPGIQPKERSAKLAETVKRAPGWRLPYLYKCDRPSLQRYAVMSEEYKKFAIQQTQQPPLPGSILTDSIESVTPDQVAAAFSWNPLLAEDLYLGYALKSKSPEKLLEKHRMMAISAYELSLRASGNISPPSPGKSMLTVELNKLAAANTAADKLVREQIRYEKQLDADTIISEATKARWAELDRVEPVPGDSLRLNEKLVKMRLEQLMFDTIAASSPPARQDAGSLVTNNPLLSKKIYAAIAEGTIQNLAIGKVINSGTTTLGLKQHNARGYLELKFTALSSVQPNFSDTSDLGLFISNPFYTKSGLLDAMSFRYFEKSITARGRLANNVRHLLRVTPRSNPESKLLEEVNVPLRFIDRIGYYIDFNTSNLSSTGTLVPSLKCYSLSPNIFVSYMPRIAKSYADVIFGAGPWLRVTDDKVRVNTVLGWQINSRFSFSKFNISFNYANDFGKYLSEGRFFITAGCNLQFPFNKREYERKLPNPK